MKGFPKHLNTKSDVLFTLERFPDQTKSYLQQLVDAKDQWMTIGTLAADDPGIEDATHRVLEMTDDAGNVTDRYQQELQEDPNGPIFRLGFMSVAEVEDLING